MTNPQNKIFIPKDVLYQWYVIEKKTIKQINDLINKNAPAGIKRLLTEYGIPMRTTEEIHAGINRSGPNNPMWGRKGSKSPTWLGGKENWKSKRQIRRSTKDKLIKKLGGKCEKCGSIEKLTIDHQPPWRICRSHDLKFLHVLCLSCHMRNRHNQR